jgi:hypothetical protein
MDNLSLMEEKIFECLTVEICIDGKKLVITSMYRSPSNDNNSTVKFLNKFDNFLENFSNFAAPVFICSDSNLNLLDLPTCNNAKVYFSYIHSNGFLQNIHHPTRVQNNSSTLIDHICSRNEQNGTTFGTILSDISDHFINFILLPDKSNPVKCNMRYSRNFSHANMSDF